MPLPPDSPLASFQARQRNSQYNPSTGTTSSSTNKGDLQPWTATRCHRLLRQLQTRLAALRKLASEAHETRRVSWNQPKRVTYNDESNKASKRARLTYGKRRRTDTSEPAPMISPAKTPPRTVRTFGAIRAAHSSPLAGQVDFPSPLWRRIRGQYASPEQTLTEPFHCLHHSATGAVPPEILKEMRLLRQLVCEEQYRHFEAILSWLASLLQSTMPQQPPTKQDAHPKSLLGMCLRKIPACIEDIEAWERQAARENREESMWTSSNVSLEMYEQLEALGSTARGWRPLRLVARSHGISLLSRAVSEGLFDSSFVGLLIRLCAHFKYLEAAATLLSSLQAEFPAPQSPQSTFAECNALQPLHSVIDNSITKGLCGLAFDCISVLIENGSLPVKWLSTRAFSNLWASSLEEMASGKAGLSVMEFICSSLFALGANDDYESPLHQGSSGQTLISICSGIAAAAMAMTSDSTATKETVHRQAWRRLVHVLDRCVVQARKYSRIQRSQSNSLYVFVLVRYLAAYDTQHANDTFFSQASVELQKLLARDGCGADLQYRQTVLLLCSVARCRSKGTSAPGHDTLAEVCKQLEALPPPKWFGSGLRTDVAFLLAQKTNNLRDLAFAESLPSTTTSTSTGTNLSGWCWDEGISEWVLPTPVSTLARGRRKSAPLPEGKKWRLSFPGRRSQSPRKVSNRRSGPVLKPTGLAGSSRFDAEIDGIDICSGGSPELCGPRRSSSLRIHRTSMILSDDEDDLV